MITQQQIEHYHQHGYVGVEQVLPLEWIEDMRRVTDEFVEKSRKITHNDAVYDLEPTHSADDPKLRRLKNPVLNHPVYDRTMRSDYLLNIVTKLIGNSVRWHNTKLNMKNPAHGSAVEWHQDVAFYPHTNDDILEVGVCLDDMTVENGALQVIPGSHIGKVYNHHQEGKFLGAIIDDEFAPNGAQSLQIKAGGITIHHVCTLHASLPNRSDKPRRLLLLGYAAVDAWPVMGLEVRDWEEFNGKILRGEPTNEARMENLHVRLPLPKVEGGSIYEQQEKMQMAPMAGRAN